MRIRGFVNLISHELARKYCQHAQEGKVSTFHFFGYPPCIFFRRVSSGGLLFFRYVLHVTLYESFELMP